MKKIISLLLIGVFVFVAGCEEIIGDNNGTQFTVDPKLSYDIPEYADVTTAIFEVTYHRISDDTEVSLISEIEKLIIHISYDTPIYFVDGKPVRDTLQAGQTLADFLNGRILEIHSTMMFQSFPGQTFPHFIRVLESYNNLKNGYIIVEMISGNILVNGEQLDRNTPVPFWQRGSEVSEDGAHLTIATAAMVPLHPIADALGIDVSYDDISDVAMNFDGVIFVPTEFFSETLNYNVFVFRGA